MVREMALGWYRRPPYRANPLRATLEMVLAQKVSVIKSSPNHTV
jgi:hypothetical protein